jgi:hypothetical protein
MMIRIVLGAIIGSVLGAWGSVVVATYLFSINAPGADAGVKNGMGFELYVALVAGAAVGVLTSVGVVSRWPDYCIYCGATAAIILVVLMPRYSYGDFWEGPDLLALPLLMAVLLLAWGIKLKGR